MSRTHRSTLKHSRERQRLGTFRRACGKVAWTTRTAAHRYAKKVTRRFDRPQRPYQCPLCGLWHLTTTPLRRNRRPC